MGGFMQPQGHLQVILNTLDFHMNPQAALDAPRWQWIEGKKVEVEAQVDPAIVEGLRSRGHEITVKKTGPPSAGVRSSGAGKTAPWWEPRRGGRMGRWRRFRAARQ